MKLRKALLLLAAFWVAFFVSGVANAQSRIALSGLTRVAVSALPGAPTSTFAYLVMDAANASDCSTGGGSAITLCVWNGSSWEQPLAAGTVGVDHIDAITEIAAALKTGADLTLVTGTAGATGECAEWDANGDLVTAGAACGVGGGTVDGITADTGGTTTGATVSLLGSGTVSTARSGDIVTITGAAPAADSIGTAELDDGADTPGSGQYLRVDTVDQAGVEYRSIAEVLSDLSVDATPAGTNQPLFLNGSGLTSVAAGLTFDGTTFTAPAFATPSVDGSNAVTVFTNTTGYTGCSGLTTNQLALYPNTATSGQLFLCDSNNTPWQMLKLGLDADAQKLRITAATGQDGLVARGSTAGDGLRVQTAAGADIFRVDGVSGAAFVLGETVMEDGWEVGSTPDIYQITTDGQLYTKNNNLVDTAGQLVGRFRWTGGATTSNGASDVDIQQWLDGGGGFVNTIRLRLGGDGPIEFHPHTTGTGTTGYAFYDDDNTHGFRMDVPDLTASEEHVFGNRVTVAKTADATLTAQEVRNGHVSCDDDTNACVLTLPALSAVRKTTAGGVTSGPRVCITNLDTTNTIQVTPNAADGIIFGDEVNPDGEYIEIAAVIGDTACFMALNTVAWVVESNIGTALVKETP